MVIYCSIYFTFLKITYSEQNLNGCITYHVQLVWTCFVTSLFISFVLAKACWCRSRLAIRYWRDRSRCLFDHRQAPHANRRLHSSACQTHDCSKDLHLFRFVSRRYSIDFDLHVSGVDCNLYKEGRNLFTSQLVNYLFVGKITNFTNWITPGFVEEG